MKRPPPRNYGAAADAAISRAGRALAGKRSRSEGRALGEIGENRASVFATLQRLKLLPSPACRPQGLARLSRRPLARRN